MKDVGLSLAMGKVTLKPLTDEQMITDDIYISIYLYLEINRNYLY